MIKVLFVCHGNICRSPMAEFVMKDLVKKAGLEAEFEIASAATSSEELGNPVYPPARRKLKEHGIDCAGKTARRITAADYEYYDLIIGMDEYNMRNMLRAFGGDKDNKLHLLMSFAGFEGRSVADPWYTGDFEAAWQDVSLGCAGLLDELSGVITLDLSACRSRHDIYAVLREKMEWESWYGENLDALWDVLTGLPHKGHSFKFIMPEDPAAAAYAEKAVGLFTDSGKRVIIAK